MITLPSNSVVENCQIIYFLLSGIFKTGPILGWSSVLRPVCECVCVSVSDTFPNAPASLEEDEEKEIYCSSRGAETIHLRPVRGSIPQGPINSVEGKGGGCAENVYPSHHQ